MRFISRLGVLLVFVCAFAALRAQTQQAPPPGPGPAGAAAPTQAGGRAGGQRVPEHVCHAAGGDAVKRRFTANNLAAVGVSLVLAALVSLVYHAFISSKFTPVRANVVNAEQTASRHLVSVTLPDLSALHGQAAVLALRLRNGGGDPKRIGLLRDGLPPHRVVVPPDVKIDWNVVLTPELVQALDIPSPDGSRTLELTCWA